MGPSLEHPVAPSNQVYVILPQLQVALGKDQGRGGITSLTMGESSSMLALVYPGLSLGPQEEG